MRSALMGLGCLLCVLAAQAQGATFYVAPSGDDANPGTLGSPWGTLIYAVAQLDAGDTLLIRGGSYYESGVTIEATGKPGAWIRIAAYPGEIPILDGRDPDFLRPNNDAWTPVDPGRHIYRSKKTFPDGWNAYGFLEERGQLYHLVTYKSYAALSTDNEQWAASGIVYVGPGVFFDESDKRIYIRLQRPDPEAVFRTFTVPADPDPRRNILHLGVHERGLVLMGASHVEIDGVDVYGFEETVRAYESEFVTFRNMRLMPGQYGLQLSSGHDYLVDGLTFEMHLPGWVSWTDMKTEPAPAGLVKLTAMENLADRVEVRNSRFLRTHDAISSTYPNTGLFVHHNTFEDIQDDALQYGLESGEMEFAYNLVIGAGPSHDSDGTPSRYPLGQKYVHHNIIDSTQPLVFWVRADPAGLLKSHFHRGQPLAPPNLIGTHGHSGAPHGDPWKIYHNTLIGADQLFELSHNLSAWSALSPSEPRHEVYNNIMILQGTPALYQARSDGSEVFDGNLYWREGPRVALFREIDGKDSYETVAELHRATGWETHGLEADPKLADWRHRDYRPDPSGPGARRGADLSSTGWPGTSGETFRGAVPPSAPDGTGGIGAPSPD